VSLAIAIALGCGSAPEPEVETPPPKKATASKPKPEPRTEKKIAQGKPPQPASRTETRIANAPPEAPVVPKPQGNIAPAAAPAAPAPEPVQKEPKNPKQGPAIRESFDKAPDGGLAAGWAQWSDIGGSIQLSSAKALSKPNCVVMSGGSKIGGRAWIKETRAADVQASAAVFVEQLIPAQVIVRGSALDGGKPTFYAASVVRGMEIKLVSVQKGNYTVLGTVKSAGWFSEQWVRLTLRAEGKQLSVQLVRLDTNECLDESGQWSAVPAWALRKTDDKIGGPGAVGIGREASYAGTIVFDDFAAGKPWDEALPAAEVKRDTSVPAPARSPAETPIVKVDAPPVPRPDVPRHYPHIRIALLAYFGNPMGALEDRLLRESVDLVVPDERFLAHINQVAPKTPSLIYTNTSSLYLDLLTDWLAYADRTNTLREAAFYHARVATKFGGNSPSSLAVNRFWKVLTGTTSLADHTSDAHVKNGRVPLGGSLYLGWPDRFREVNIELISGAAGGWKAALECPTEVDAQGKPTKWAALKPVTDTTNGLQSTGQITFDPSPDWKPATIHGDARLYYVRFRATSPGRAPVAGTILGRDYVDAKGTTSGVIPAFDSDADKNKDGYLDDVEYANRAPGKDARFIHESRMFTRSYGQMRFAVNPSGPGFSGWAIDYHKRFLARSPLAAGLFMDNSEGKSAVDAGDVLEPVHRYAADYGTLLSEIEKAIAPHWVLANTAGGGRHCEPVIQYNPAYFEEFMIRPLSHNWTLYEDIAEAVERRARLTTPPPLAVIDSYPSGGKVDDPRMQLGVLAYYYLLAEPDWTYLTFFGGYEPGTAWDRHWSPAVAFDVGRPTGKQSVFATGTDPAATDLTFKVYQRQYEKALILFKPLSHHRAAKTAATIEDNTATKHDLGGTYRQVQPDGSLGPPITSISLRNGEGAILAKPER
jgi:hypothetical protein